MVMNNTLAAALSHILNCERNGKKEAVLKPSSKIIKSVLELLNHEGFLGSHDIIEDGRGNMIKLNLLGNINKCGVVSPRFAVAADGFEKYEKRYLPARDFGVLVVLTSQGMMTHKQAKEKGIGGRLAAYCY